MSNPAPAATEIPAVLRPDQRSLLFDALRPPAGYQLDQAVGTSFTLDLSAIIVAAVAFSSFDTARPDGMPLANPVAIFEAVRRAGPRITIFSQAGEIGVPAFRSEFAFLEQSIVQVRSPTRGGVFHPKIWMVRFAPTDEFSAQEHAAGRQAVRRYRFLCMSRNLTFDRAWDTILQLDGVPSTTRPYVNRPLADFIRRLPGLATQPLGGRAEAILSLAEDVRSVRWEALPDPLRLEWFWPLGLDQRHASPMANYPAGAMLVVSPFVKKGLLGSLLRDRPDSTLVTREQTLRELGRDGSAPAQRVCVLRSGLIVPAVEGTSVDGDQPAPDAELQGLHAKLYAIDSPDGLRMWTGSANATDAGFGANVEFLVQLRSRDRRHTVAAMLEPGPADRPTLGSMLEDWEADAEPELETDAEKASRTLGDIARSLGGLVWTARVRSAGEGRFKVSLAAQGDGLPIRQRGLAVTIRPLGSDGSEVPIGLRGRTIRARFDSGFADLSAFFVIDLRLQTGQGKEEGRSVLIPALLLGVPRDRLARLQAAGLGPDGFRRLLLLLLGTLESASGDGVALHNAEPWTGTSSDSPLGLETLLEPLLRTLARAPERLPQINELIVDLQKTMEGRDLLPEGWTELWAAVSSAKPRGRR